MTLPTSSVPFLTKINHPKKYLKKILTEFVLTITQNWTQKSDSHSLTQIHLYRKPCAIMMLTFYSLWRKTSQESKVK